jgi:hypothetical protein
VMGFSVRFSGDGFGRLGDGFSGWVLVGIGFQGLAG